MRTLTFFLTDIEGSTRLWEEHPAGMAVALARHDELVAAATSSHGGTIVKSRGEGDSAFCVFPSASGAAGCAIELQRALADEPWPPETPIRIRIALHTGEAEVREGDYYGATVNRCARLRAVSHGGQVVVSEATAQLAADALPAQAWFLDLGLHRLKDLARPERVFQLCHPALAVEFPPLRSLEAARHNLPLQLTTFVGRAGEMTEVTALLAGSRLVTLVGAGGAGKTRLSIQVGAEVLDRYPDGVWLAELAPLSDAGLVPKAVADALGVREEPGRSLEDTLTGALAGSTVLLLLDNCEHVVDACARLADDLVRSCPGVTVLATSREPLAVAGETIWRIPSLPAPDPEHLPPPGALGAYESVRLFVDRAELSRPGFALTDDNGAAVAQICAHLDGIPLAIELAAARVRSLTPQQIAVRLDDRFRLLTGGARTAMPRQQTLRAAIDWGYELLDAGERELFRRLAVFAGGFTLEAAEAVCEGDIIEVLPQLAAKSLVTMEERDGRARYRMLETIREYAREKLDEAGELPALRDRHLGWFLALAERAEPELAAAGQRAWLEQLEAEHDNLRRALDWAAVGAAEQGLRMASAVWRFWWVRGHLGEGRDRLERALRDADAAPDAARAKALNAAGILAYAQGDYAAARERYRASLALRREIDDRAGVAASLGNLGTLAFVQGDYDTARALYGEGLEIRRELDDRQNIAHSLNDLANVAATQGQYADARALYAESLAIRRALADRAGVAASLNNLGNVLYSQGELEGARALHTESLAIKRELGDKWGVAASLNNLGSLALLQGDHAGAREMHAECLTLFRELGDKRGIATATNELGRVAAAHGDLEGALGHHRESLTLFGDLGDRRGTAESIEALAALAAAGSDGVRAARLFGAAEGLREAIGAPIPPSEEEAHRRSVERARTATGAEAFEAAWAKGRALAPEEAVAEALGAPG